MPPCSSKDATHQAAASLPFDQVAENLALSITQLNFSSATLACIAAGVAISLMCACSNSENEPIGAEIKQIIRLKPLIDHGETPWPTHPSENIANQLVNALEARSPGSSAAIKACAAKDNPASEKCQVGETYDEECSIKRGYWKGFIGKHLFYAKTDLNGDKIPDYIIRGDQCSGFSNTYTWEVFVLLSQKEKPYKLALALNTNRFDVMPLVKYGGQVIVDGISSYNGESINIQVLQHGEYVPEACFYRDHKDIDQGRDLHSVACAQPTR